MCTLGGALLAIVSKPQRRTSTVRSDLPRLIPLSVSLARQRRPFRTVILVSSCEDGLGRVVRVQAGKDSDQEPESVRHAGLSRRSATLRPAIHTTAAERRFTRKPWRGGSSTVPSIERAKNGVRYRR